MNRSLLQRPVGISVVCVFLAAFGLLALSHMDVSLAPNLEEPVLLVRTEWEGAAPRLVEQRITEPLEAQLATLENLAGQQSLSLPGQSFISLRFRWTTNLDLAFLNVREKLEQARFLLPDQAQNPTLLRSSASDRPLATLAVRYADAARIGFSDQVDLWRWADRVFSRRLEQINGVSQALLVGQVQPQVAVELDPDRLARYGIGVEQVSNRIRENNLFAGAGELQEGWYRYSVKFDGRFSNLAELEQLPILRLDSGRIIRLGQVATLRQEAAQARNFSLLDGFPVLTLFVKKNYGENDVTVFDRIKPVVEQMRQTQPDIVIEVVDERASIVSGTITNLLFSLVLGGFLSFIVLFVFLNDRRLPLVLGLSIPISVMSTLLIMFLLDIQLNVVSISGLTLGIGLLVDNSIVVLENIKRYAEEGLGRIEAAFRGTKEVAFAATASTLTTISVFVPLLFLGEVEGAIFRQQAITFSLSLLVSLFVAVFILPTFAASLLGDGTKAEPRLLLMLLSAYENTLNVVLKRPLPAIFVALAFLVLAGLLFRSMPQQLLPDMPNPSLSAELTLPENTRLETAASVAQTLNAQLASLSGYQQGLAVGGFTDQSRPDQIRKERLHRFRLNADFESVAQKEQAARQLQAWQTAHPDWNLELQTQENPFTRLFGSGSAMELALVDPDRHIPQGMLSEIDTMLSRLKPGTKLRPSHDAQLSVIELLPKRQRWLDFGVADAEMQAQIQSLMLGFPSTEWEQGDITQSIRLFLTQNRTFNLEDAKIESQGRQIPLSSLFEVRQTRQPELLERRLQSPIELYQTGWTTFDFIQHQDQLRLRLNRIGQTYGRQVLISGSAVSNAQTLTRIAGLIAVSALLIFLILAVQYESLILPLIIMFSVPFAWIGTVLFLAAWGLSINLFALLGTLVLTGIAVNDAILKVDFMRRYTQETGDVEQAIRQAGHHRFRPVIMTTITTILGMAPLLFATGEFAQISQSLSGALIGGMLSATALTLFIIPIIYRIAARWVHPETLQHEAVHVT